jgi:hypothetical protein
MSATAPTLRDVYQFTLGQLSEQEQKSLAAAFSAVSALKLCGGSRPRCSAETDSSSSSSRRVAAAPLQQSLLLRVLLLTLLCHLVLAVILLCPCRQGKRLTAGRLLTCSSHSQVRHALCRGARGSHAAGTVTEQSHTIPAAPQATSKPLPLHLPVLLSRSGSNPTSIDPKRVAALKPLVRRGIPYEMRPTQVPCAQGLFRYPHSSLA